VLSGPAILRISVLLIIAGLLAAVVQFLLPSPAPEPESRPASPAASSSKPAPVAEPPTEAQPAEPPAASAEPVRAPPAPPRTAAVPAAPAQMPSDALAVPSDPAAPPEAPDAAGQAEIDRAEDTAGPRAVAVVDLNTASVADLNRLRGGGAIGRAIVAKRPYTSVDQLLSKRVLSRSVYERIRDQVTVR
jgi:cytoskeletal protein RodZ